MAEIAKSADQILEELFQSLCAGNVELPLDICGASKLQENGDEPNSTEAVPGTVVWLEKESVVKPKKSKKKKKKKSDDKEKRKKIGKSKDLDSGSAEKEERVVEVVAQRKSASSSSPRIRRSPLASKRSRSRSPRTRRSCSRSDKIKRSRSRSPRSRPLIAKGLRSRSPDLKRSHSPKSEKRRSHSKHRSKRSRSRSQRSKPLVRSVKAEKSPSRSLKSRRSRSPKARKSRSRSPKARKSRSRSPKSRKSRSRSPKVRKSRSRSPKSRKLRSRSPKPRKSRSRSPKPRKSRSPKSRKADREAAESRRSLKTSTTNEATQRSPQRAAPKRLGQRQRSRSPHIDKAQLLEAARRNLKRMQETGLLRPIIPSAGSVGLAAATLLATSAGTTATTATSDSVDRVAASKSSGGKTVEELTDYCKNLVGASDDDDWHDPAAVACRADQTRHPFQIKPRSDTIVMNIRNAIPIPVRKPEERVVAQAQLKQQFPISSGQQHLDLEWIPVSGDKDRTKKASAVVVPVPRQVAKVEPPPPPPAIDIGAVVAQRISAVRKLQENEQDVQAQMELQEAEMLTRSWAHVQPQQQQQQQQQQQHSMTNPMTGEPLPELIDWSGAPQAWVRRDQFTNAAPLAGGVGMKLLQKMGWQPGQGLGRNMEGTLEPLTLDIKMDKKGLVSKEEIHTHKPAKLQHTFQGKHPVSMLHELCTKKKWDPPLFEQVADIGPDHQKHFLFKVVINGVEYRHSMASTTKKEAKAQSAAFCLQSLGIGCTSLDSAT